MSKPIQNVSLRLKELMESTGDKQIDMARKTGISKGTLTKYVNGKMGMKQSRIEHIAEVYGVDPAWLLGFDVPKRRLMSYITEPKHEVVSERIVRYGELLAKFDKLSDSDRTMIEDMIDRLNGGDQNGQKEIQKA